MTPREKECKACDNDKCKCRTCRGIGEVREYCGCAFDEQTKCSWPNYMRVLATEEDIQ